MGTLLLKLSGPLQSWGVDSRYLERKTRHEPTKSGLVGMLAAALGRCREEAIDDLAMLHMAVRVDQRGYIERDFQTAHPRSYSKKEERWTFSVNASGTVESLPLSKRYYLSGAVFVAAIELEDERLEQYEEAFMHPVFPLYLGRRSCPPSEKVLLGSCAGMTSMDALSRVPWQATDRSLIRKHAHDDSVSLEVLRDKYQDEVSPKISEVVRDVPLSFSQERREYGLRTVVHDRVRVANGFYVASDGQPQEHDPMSLLDGEVV